MPQCTKFGPATAGDGGMIEMSVDEYETIRLIDFEGLKQEECAQQMEVARTTVQSIYASARYKLAQCIVLGARLNIIGGHVQFCDHHEHACGGGRGHGRRCHLRQNRAGSGKDKLRQ